ncbi:hypothetical protein HXX76_002202 [Chlamydomonas incerta]|uniref:BACK domain-containing protein n=1 Tax=Chlamydomonas incerta TaxID=51695 RepID=A0A836B0N7_CHLIN|nr:hypothetical protein HXX76_002202 [Chlamydomonas incerta]|eukprot:KAG2443859.1 hypothetical protein HXX76_002202 [Chlamydomonas incerta]
MPEVALAEQQQQQPAMAPQQPSINPKVAAAIGGLFGRSEDADCQLVFVLDPAPPTGEPPSGGGAAAGCGCTHKEAARLAEPLPAHSFVLRHASDKIAAQLAWARMGASTSALTSKTARASGAAAKAAAPLKQLPEVQLMLGGEEELPAARAAIQFAYTGRVQPGSSVREALQPAAAGSVNAAVLELCSGAALWSDAAENAAFAAALREAKQQLAAHFGDALAVLNDKQLHEQVVALPAAALAALLESDDFGTDSESSGVLVLAEWMAVNYGSTDEALRRRLCGPLRLVQCSRAYLCGVLPVLAARHQRSPTSAAGWFPMTPAEATCMLAYSTASEPERKAMAAEGAPSGPCAGMAMVPAGWRNTQPRRRCLSEGRSFDCSASLTEMETSFGDLKPGEKGFLYLRLLGSRPGDRVVAQGLRWQPYLQWASGASTAGVFVTPRVPAALAATATPGAAAAEEGLLTEAVVAVPRMHVSVRGAAGQQSWSEQYGDGGGVAIGAVAGVWLPARLEGSIVLLPPAS